MPTVFLSYRQEDDPHSAQVRDLGERLENAGVTVVLDQLAQAREFHGGGPNDGWPRWSRQQAGNPAHKVLIVASPGWFCCYDGTQKAGTGLGAAAEAAVIEQRLYNSAGYNADIRIVALGPLAPAAVPLGLQRYHRFTDPTDFGDLTAWLSGGVAVIQQGTHQWPVPQSRMPWPIANHDGVRASIEALLTHDSESRVLTLRGPTEAGKSHVIRQILGHGLRVPGLACGRFDFKGTTDVEREIRTFVQHLDIPLPSLTNRLTECLGQILHSLNQRSRPTLLLFDTYEVAGEAESWITEQLLPSVIRARWLRVVVAGQRVPERTGAPWAMEALAPFELSVPPPEDWHAFGAIHRPSLTIDLVRQIYDLSKGRAGLLAQLLGPSA